MKIKLFGYLMIIFLLGCSQGLDRKIDASNTEKLKESIQLIKKELPADQYAKFQEAYEMIVFSNLDTNGNNIFESMARLTEMIKNNDPKILGHIQGKTPKEIISMAIDKLTIRINELEKKKASADASRQILNKISISKSKFYIKDSRFITQPVIEFTIKNDTGKALSWIDCHGVLITPGRSVPWIEEDFNYNISGGLESGEIKHLSLLPNMFSKWSNSEVKDRKDVVLNVIVNNAKDASGIKIATDFDKYDKESLLELNNKVKRMKL